MRPDQGKGMWQSWEKLARCADADPAAFFPHAETEYNLEFVKEAFCNLCPVQPQCLSRALVNGDTGFYGGTSTAQRRAMTRVRTRAKCPVCANTAVLVAAPYQICTCCGTSWKADGSLTAGRVALPHQVSGPVTTVPDPRGLVS